MPLVERNSYTWEEARNLITERFPGEDPISNLIEALSVPFPREVLTGYVVSEESGRAWVIPPEAVRSKNDFRYDPKLGRGRLRVRGLVEPLVVEGPIEIRRDQLDTLVGMTHFKSTDSEETAEEEGQPAGATDTQHRKRPRKQDIGKDALKKIKIKTVVAKAKTKWPDRKKRPGINAMARELVRTHHKELGFDYETVKKILAGTYPASKRLGVPRLD